MGKRLGAIPAIYTGKGVAPEVNLKEYTSHTPVPSVNTAAHFAFESHRGNHQKFKTGVSVAPECTCVHKIEQVCIPVGCILPAC